MASIRVANITTVDLTLQFLLRGQLLGLRDEGFEVTTISASGPWTSQLEGEGLRHIPWPSATRSWDPRADVRAFVELMRILRRGRFHLVHTHTPKAGVLGRIAARLSGVPCVVNTVHGLYAMPEDHLLKRVTVLALEGIASRFSDLELYVSEEDLVWARRIRVVRPGGGVLLGGGIDLTEYDPARVPAARMRELRRELGLGDETVVVGTVGRLVAEKGYRELFTAARAIGRRPDVRFLVVGEIDRGKEDAIGDEELDAVRDLVVAPGWRQDVRDLLAVIDIFVLPSWREGLPRSAIEAAAMGKALVLSDIRGCREVARDGREGILVPPRAPDLLSRAIARLVEDEDLRVRLGRAARARVLERFDERRVTDAVVARYRQILARRGLGPASPVGSAGEGAKLEPSRGSLAAPSGMHFRPP